MSLKLDFYKDCFHQIRRNICRGRVINAKPCLLIAAIDSVWAGDIRYNQFVYNEELLKRYKEIWHHYLSGQNVTPMWKPFFYLTSEGFWHLKWKGKELHTKSPSNKFIRDNIEYAYLDEDLWELLQNEKERETLKNQLIKMIQEYQ